MYVLKQNCEEYQVCHYVFCFANTKSVEYWEVCCALVIKVNVGVIRIIATTDSFLLLCNCFLYFFVWWRQKIALEQK